MGDSFLLLLLLLVLLITFFLSCVFAFLFLLLFTTSSVFCFISSESFDSTENQKSTAPCFELHIYIYTYI